jgi:hypothetical protein
MFIFLWKWLGSIEFWGALFGLAGLGFGVVFVLTPGPPTIDVLQRVHELGHRGRIKALHPDELASLKRTYGISNEP